MVSDFVVLRVLLSPEDELAVTQAVASQNHKSVDEVRALGQPKSSRVPTVQFLCSDSIVRLAAAKYRSFSR